MVTDPVLIDYYARRAAEYEEIYEKPERQADLIVLKELVRGLFVGHHVLEVACGTGYWTEVISPVCRSILATDAGKVVLDLARDKSFGSCDVRFAVANAYDLGGIDGDFTAGLAGFWWSHVPKERLRPFLRGFHRRLRPGALVCHFDNRYVQDTSRRITFADSEGNTYQRRSLKDGSKHTVLKNFATEEELRSTVAEWSMSAEVKRLTYYWCLSYRLDVPAEGLVGPTGMEDHW